MQNILGLVAKNLNIDRVKNKRESVRAFHGRGNILPDFNFFNIDYFAPYFLISLFSEVSKEFLKELCGGLKEICPHEIKGVIVHERFKRPVNSYMLMGDWPSEILMVENGLSYELNLKNQNIGMFLDIREGRNQVSKISKDRRVLNLFSYTCSFSVVAKKFGAVSVVNLDMNKNVLNWGKRNHLRNKVALDGVKFYGHNLFKSWGLLKRLGPFDLIIVDPPTNQGESFKVERDYPKILKKIHDLISDSGIVMATLNSPFLSSDFLIESFSEYLPEFKLQNISFSPPEFYEKERESGLKILMYKKEL